MPGKFSLVGLLAMSPYSTFKVNLLGFLEGDSSCLCIGSSNSRSPFPSSQLILCCRFICAACLVVVVVVVVAVVVGVGVGVGLGVVVADDVVSGVVSGREV